MKISPTEEAAVLIVEGMLNPEADIAVNGLGRVIETEIYKQGWVMRDQRQIPKVLRLDEDWPVISERNSEASA